MRMDQAFFIRPLQQLRYLRFLAVATAGEHARDDPDLIIAPPFRPEDAASDGRPQARHGTVAPTRLSGRDGGRLLPGPSATGHTMIGGRVKSRWFRAPATKSS